MPSIRDAASDAIIASTEPSSDGDVTGTAISLYHARLDALAQENHERGEHRASIGRFGLPGKVRQP